MLEPRVMRVLVALASASGKVLSRDDLIALCWDGQIVGDNAINRVISQLRQVLADLAGTAVKLETITKVGFRSIVDSHSRDDLATNSSSVPAHEPVGQRTSRIDRRLVIGGGVAALAAAGAVGWRSLSARGPDPEAVRLVERGHAVMKSARMGSTPEAIRLYGQR